MGFWSGTKKAVGHVIDVRVDRWFDFETLKNSTVFFWNHTRTLFSIKQAEHTESFEDAVERLELTPEALHEQSQSFLYLSFFFVLMAGALLTYGLILFFIKNWMGVGICLSLALYALSLAFRFHFWHFQISQRKLGCRVQEWAQVFTPAKRKNLP